MDNLNARFKQWNKVELGTINSLNDIINKGYTEFVTFEEDNYNPKKPFICFKKSSENPDAIILSYNVYFGLVDEYIFSNDNNNEIDNLLELVKNRFEKYISVK